MSCIVTMLCVLLFIPPAYAAVVLDHITRRIDSVDTGSTDFFFINENRSGVPFTSQFNAAFAMAQQTSVLNVIPDSGILRGASGSGSIFDGAQDTHASSRLQLTFTVNDQPAILSLQADTIGASPGTLVRLTRMHSLPFTDVFNHVGTSSVTFEEELEVGSYQFEIRASRLGAGGGRQSWEFDLVFPFGWVNPVDGVFSDGTKWTVGRAPAADDMAIFDQPGTYTVQLDRNVTNKRLDVTGDGANVTLDLDGHRYQLGDLRLGDPSGNFAFTLADSSGIVAAPPADGGPWPAPGTGEAVVTNLTAKGPGTTTITAKSTTQSGLIEDRHFVTIAEGGDWQVDELIVGDERGANLLILAGGKVGSRSVSIGRHVRGALSSPGKVNVSGLVGLVGTFESTEMIVGVDGKGELEISSGGHVSPLQLLVGEKPNGDGLITVIGSTALLHSLGTQTIGFEGKGTLNVLGSARVVSDDTFVVGGRSSADGAVNVNNNGSVLVNSTLFVGSLGKGTLSVRDGGIVEARSATIGQMGNVTVGNGGSLVANNELTVNGELSVNTSGAARVGSGVSTVGTLSLNPGGTLKGNGTIRANLRLAGGVPQFTGSRLAPANSTGTLTIEGDIVQEPGSAMEIEIGGTADGQFDVLKITGNATLGGDVFLKFTNGFSPQQGQQFKFLDVTGALSGSFGNVQLRNLAPGFQFDLSSGGGGMTMVALNDGAFMLPESSAWDVDASGNWSSVANWSDGDLSHAGATAVLGNKITAPRTITADAPVTVGRIDFDNANTYTVAGDGTLTLDATSGEAQINVTSGSHSIAAPVSLADNTVITVAPLTGSLGITGQLSADGVNLTKAGAGTLTVANVRAAGLSISGGTVAVASNGTDTGVSLVTTLAIASDATPTATLDLADNAAIVDYTGTSPATLIRQQILAGRGGSGLGKTWNGQGITSSTAATAEPESRSIGYAENSALPLGVFTTFGGQMVDDTSVLIAFTRTGDANLDGVVNDDDVTIVGATYAPGVPNPHWALGDFDYNGFVDDDDVTLLGVFYDPSAAPLAAPFDSPAQLAGNGVANSDVAAVPEPNSVALFIVAAVCLLVPLVVRFVHRGRDSLTLPAQTSLLTCPPA